MPRRFRSCNSASFDAEYLSSARGDSWGDAGLIAELIVSFVPTLSASVDDGLLVLLVEDGRRFTADDFGDAAWFFLDILRSTAGKNVDNLGVIGVCRLTTWG
jgi:hypothetical protein